MDIKLFLVVFGTVFLAELGDKTQLATLLFATRDSNGLWTVFAGASLALIAASGIAVIGGSFLSQYLSPTHLAYIAGIGFILIGVLTIWQASP